MRKITKRTAAIFAASVIAVGGGAAAWAAVTGWTIGGEGKATGDAAKIVKMEATAKVGDKVYPGWTGKVATEVDNPNEFPVKLSTTPLQVTGFTVKGAPAACEADLKAQKEAVLVAAYPASAPAVAAKAQKSKVDATFTVGSLPQSCAGASFEVAYTFSGTSTTV